MKTILLSALCVLAITSCVPRARPAMVRTTTSHPGQFGASPFQTTVETPYESPGFTAAAAGLFSRP